MKLTEPRNTIFLIFGDYENSKHLKPVQCEIKYDYRQLGIYATTFSMFMDKSEWILILIFNQVE